ncbi:MAG TPA: DUF881 domain-containing protein [Actinomycetes bacterium]|nr:DUF881 domain-containing protein [Actinomycetes bacterium]
MAAALAAMVAGLLFVISGRVADGTDLRPGRSVRLADLITETERDNAVAQRELSELRAEVAALTAAQPGGGTVAALRAATNRLRDSVGLAPAGGPGVSVTLDDAPAGEIDREHPGWPEPTPDDLVVHQQDLESVVNALWAGGATAMGIMDQRVISTSAVRCVGNTLILHGRVYAPPYRIAAVGDPGDLTRALAASDGIRVYRQYVTAYGLGYAVRRQSNLELSGYVGPIELDHARTVG